MAVLKERVPARTPGNGNGSDRLKRPLVISVSGHVVLLVAVLWGALIGRRESLWGEGSSSGGGAASVRLVSAASIPLPPQAVASTNKVANEEPGLHFSEAPKPQPKPVPEKAVELPGRNTKRAAPKKLTPRQEARLYPPDREIRPANEIPYGAGGPPRGPYGMFRSDSGTGGFAFSESAGDFASRYGWYVTALRGRISNNWLQGTVDPNIRVAPRVYVTFEILRDGQVVNAQLTASSGVSSLDRSALRAVYDSSPMPPLPSDYRGSSVAVEFWFDFRR